MSSVKWIKLTTGMFDDEKIKIIESMPEKDTILIIWIKLLVLAGKTNASGYLFLSQNIPYTDEMLSTLFNRPLSSIRMAIEVFKMFGMLDVDENALCISNWEKHQNVEGLDRIRENNRNRVKNFREKKLNDPDVTLRNVTCNVTRNVTVTQCNAIEVDIDIDIDKEREKEEDVVHLPPSPSKNPSTPYEEIKTIYNEICKSLPKVNTLSSSRKKKIKCRWIEIGSMDKFKALFEKSENTPFLKGNNPRGWTATFDWLMENDKNWSKVMEGNYETNSNAKATGKPVNSQNFDQRKYEDSFYENLYSNK
jgi:predicted phage replisome organizer